MSNFRLPTFEDRDATVADQAAKDEADRVKFLAEHPKIVQFFKNNMMDNGHKAVVNPNNDDWLEEIIPGNGIGANIPPDVGSIMEHSGKLPQFSVAFNPKKLATIDVLQHVDHFNDIEGGYTKEMAEQNLREMLACYAKLPELHFDSGQIYYIYGPNGSGKSILCDSILLAIQMKHNELSETTKRFRDAKGFDNDGKVLHRLPDIIWREFGSGKDGIPDLVKAIANTIQINDLITSETEGHAANSAIDLVDGIRFSVKSALSTMTNRSGAQQSLGDAIKLSAGSTWSNRQRGDKFAVVLDEPETSLDRDQKLRLEDFIEEVRSRFGEHTIALVPTHMESIYRNPNALRIDLAKPEEGIHKPTDQEIYDYWTHFFDELPDGVRKSALQVLGDYAVAGVASTEQTARN